MKREQILNWMERKGKVSYEKASDGELWNSVSFETNIAMKGEFVNFVGKAKVRMSVFSIWVIVTIDNRGCESVSMAFKYDDLHRNHFENEHTRVEFL